MDMHAAKCTTEFGHLHTNIHNNQIYYHTGTITQLSSEPIKTNYIKKHLNKIWIFYVYDKKIKD